MAGRTPGPTGAIIDSQSVKAAEEVSRASRGCDAGKKINGRKRHITVEAIGLLEKLAGVGLLAEGRRKINMNASHVADRDIECRPRSLFPSRTGTLPRGDIG